MNEEKATRERDEMNAEGDFYVEKDACLCCMLAPDEAPELMGFDEAHAHCYFKRQPETPEETERAIKAMWVSEIQGLRYAGNSPEILEKLKSLELVDCCDEFERSVRKKAEVEILFVS